MAGEPAYTRWTPTEWQTVAAHALRYIDKGIPLAEALFKAQRLALPKDRHREEQSLAHSTYGASAQANKYIAQVRALPKEALEALAPPPAPRKAPPPRKKLDDGRPDYGKLNGVVRWTTLEKARIARQVKQWQDAGDKRVLARLIIEAQELVLPVERRRSAGSIGAGAGVAGHNDQMMVDGLKNVWLIKDEPAAPPAVEPELPEVEAQETAQEPAAPVLATTPPAPGHSRLSEAARVFGDTVMSALDVLLRVHAEELMHGVESRIASVAKDIGLSVAAQIEQGMRKTVHQIVEVELGGPVASPPATGEAPAPVAKAKAPRVAFEFAPEQPAQAPGKIVVDVFAFPPQLSDMGRVRRSFNGSLDLQFINPDNAEKYTPREGGHVILLTNRIPPAARHSIEKAGIEPLLVKPTANHVIHAIEELHRSAGMALHSVGH